MKYQKLRGRIVEKFGGVPEFAKALGCSPQNVYQMLKAPNGMSFATIEKWMRALDIKEKDLAAYFFARKVQKNETSAE